MRPSTTTRTPAIEYDEVLARNPKLVYGRMTGWGQDGPMASQSGHDINYIAIGGVLGAFAREGERPLFPLNLVGDYGGGAMMLAFGVLAGILNVRSGGEGQVVDAAMVEGSSLLATLVRSMADIGMWSDVPGTNLLDSGAHFYEVYECADGGHFAVGAIEPQFYAELLRLLELDPAEFPQLDRDRWPEFKEAFAELFMTRTRDEWSAVFEGSEACATPVLTFAEAPAHPHNAARGSFIEVGGKVQPGPAPRFSGTPAGEPSPAPEPGANTDEALTAWGVAADEIASLRDSGAVA